MRFRPYHGIMVQSTTQRRTARKHKVSTRILSTTKHLQTVPVYKLNPLTAHGSCKTSCQVNMSVRACEDVTVLFLVRRKRDCLPRNSASVSLTITSCALHLHKESFSFLFLFFFYLDPSISECWFPLRMSLFGPDKILEIPSLAVNREIL